LAALHISGGVISESGLPILTIN